MACVLLAALVVAAAVLSGCGGGAGGSSTAIVTGRVRDGLTDAVINVATVSIGSVTVTTTNGEFTLTGIAVGSTRLVVSSSGYNTRSIPITVNAGVNRLGDIYLYQANTGSVSGRVVAATSGQPLVNATATIGSQTVRCSAAGEFEIPGVDVGPATVVLAAPGYVAQSRTVNVAAGANTDIGDVPLVVDQGGDVPGKPRTIEGTITLEGQSDNSGVQVTLIGTDISYPAPLTQSDGAYSIWAPAGDYTLQASKSGYVTKEQAVTIRTDQVLQVNLTLSPT